MNASIKIILATGAAIALVSPAALGQSSRPSSEVDGDFTLKGDSLRTVESRTTSQDYQRFREVPARNNSADEFARTHQGGTILKIDERTDVVFEDDTDWGTSFGVFQPSGDIVDSRSVQIRLQLD